MKNQNHIPRVSLEQIRIEDILFEIKEQGRPYILTEKGRGVAAILPYVDPQEVNNSRQV